MILHEIGGNWSHVEARSYKGRRWPCYCCTGFCSIFATLTKMQKAHCLLIWNSKFAPTVYVIVAFYLIMCLCICCKDSAKRCMHLYLGNKNSTQSPFVSVNSGLTYITNAMVRTQKTLKNQILRSRNTWLNSTLYGVSKATDNIEWEVPIILILITIITINSWCHHNNAWAWKQGKIGDFTGIIFVYMFIEWLWLKHSVFF